jgi:dihydrofolate reductase
MAIIGIVAVAKNLAIGRGGKLPWHYSSDLKFFKETTSGNAVVMGRTTFESIGKPLPNRLNIVLSRTADIGDQPHVLKHLLSKKEVLEFAQDFGRDVYIIGGARVFESFAGEIEKWIVTEVPLTVEDADTFMPANFLDGFELTANKELEEGLKIKFFERR